MDNFIYYLIAHGVFIILILNNQVKRTIPYLTTDKEQLWNEFKNGLAMHKRFAETKFS